MKIGVGKMWVGLAATTTVVVAAITSLSALIAGGPTPRHNGTLANPSDYEVQNFGDFCFEPDVFNISGENRTFTIQLQIGDEFSEVHTDTLEDGGRSHLHLFAGYWAPGPEQLRLIHLADTQPCTLLVFDDA